MSVRYNIDFQRFIGAAFGQSWEGEFNADLLVERFGEQLGFSADDSREFQAVVKHATKSFAERLSTRQGLLRLYPTLKQGEANFTAWASETFAKADTRTRVVVFLESHFLFWRKEWWADLQRFVYAFWIARSVDPFSRVILREIQVLTMQLITEDEGKYLRADTTWHPFGGDTDDDAKRFLQSAGRVGHRLLGASNPSETAEVGEDQTADLHEKMPDIIDAWNIAYENQIFHICCFLWFAKRDLAVPADLAFAPKQRGDISKGAVYNEVKDWCVRNNLSFPFHAIGVDIRNAVFHGRYLLEPDQQLLVFLDSDMKPRDDIKHIPYKDLYYDLLHDVAVTQHFLSGKILGELTVMNFRGRFDAAWSEFRAKVPNYTWVFDRTVNSISPLGERASTKEEVKSYLEELSPIELAALLAELREAWLTDP